MPLEETLEKPLSFRRVLYNSYFSTMKFFISLLLLLIVIASCKGQKNPYQLEDNLYACIVKNNLSSGIDIETKMDSLHNFLVKSKVLKDYSGESIIALIEKVGFDNQLPKISYQPKINILNISLTSNSINKFCNDLDMKLFDDTSLKIYKVGEGLRSLKDISPKNVSKVALKTLSAKDFEHPYYKTFFLTSLLVLSNREVGLKESLPPIPDSENSPRPEKENIFEVSIGTGDTLFVEGKLEKLSNLKQLAKTFITNHNPMGVVSLTTKRATSYDFYVKVQDVIRSAYKEIRNEYALKTYGKSFDRLSKEEKQTVRKIYPQRISEAEPQSY